MRNSVGAPLLVCSGSVPRPQRGLSNGQCKVFGTGFSAAGSGKTLTLNVRFSSSFAGERIIYVAARDVAERNLGWQAIGRWTAP